jgi:hypothetical protein
METEHSLSCHKSRPLVADSRGYNIVWSKESRTYSMQLSKSKRMIIGNLFFTF